MLRLAAKEQRAALRAPLGFFAGSRLHRSYPRPRLEHSHPGPRTPRATCARACARSPRSPLASASTERGEPHIMRAARGRRVFGRHARAAARNEGAPRSAQRRLRALAGRATCAPPDHAARPCCCRAACSQSCAHPPATPTLGSARRGAGHRAVSVAARSRRSRLLAIIRLSYRRAAPCKADGAVAGSGGSTAGPTVRELHAVRTALPHFVI